MRASELLNESMTMWVPDAPREKVKTQCVACDGTGAETWSGEKYPCFDCNQRGYYDEYQSESPEMNLSNANARAVMSALGYEPEEGYKITPQEIPDVKRKILRLLNRDEEIAQHTRQTSDTQADFGMQRSKDPETGIDRIERKQGPRMIDIGIDEQYLRDKFERMLSILNYAQKHNQEIHFA